MATTPEENKVARSYTSRDLAKFDCKENIVNQMSLSGHFDKRLRTELHGIKKIGFYSLKIHRSSRSRQYFADASGLSYLDLDSRKFYDLNIGYNNLIKWGQDQCGIDELLKWVLKNRDKLSIDQESSFGRNLNTDFICYRGVLTKIMTTPYEKREDWMVIAVKIKGTIYLVHLVTDTELSRNAVRDEVSNKLSYANFCFEKMVSRCPTASELSDEEKVYSLNLGVSNQFNCVFKSLVNEHSLVYGAAIDCVEDESQLIDPLADFPFLEIKTTATIKKNYQHVNFHRYKAIKWWAQCYLANIETIICGYRDPDIIVRKIDRMPVDQLEDRSTQWWSPNVCLNFLNDFLNTTLNVVTKEMVCYQIYFVPGKEISFAETELPVESFIPRWYTDELLSC